MATDRRNTNAPLMHVHVIGRGVGESIVIQMPHPTERDKYRWGVVDCYCGSSDPQKNPTLRLLKANRNIGADELEFVCLTHPHEDHLLGLSQVFNDPDIKVHRLWRFGGEDARMLEALKILREWSPEHRIIGRVVQELHEVFRLSTNLRTSSDPSKYRVISGYVQSLYEYVLKPGGSEPPTTLRIAALAPCGRQIDRFAEALAGCLRCSETTDGHSFDAKRFDSIQNCVSVVLLIRYGEAQVILGGDAERDAWDSILSDGDREGAGDGISCHALKISHHGSANAFHEAAWEEHQAGGKPVGVITPYRRALPEPAMRRTFADRTSRLIITNEPVSPTISTMACQSPKLRKQSRRAVSADATGASITVDPRGRIVRAAECHAGRLASAPSHP